MRGFDVLRELGYELVVSPYHDKDINADGSKNHVTMFYCKGGRNVDNIHLELKRISQK